MRRNRIDHVAKLSLAPAGSFRPLLNFLESFLQLGSGLPLFGHIHDDAYDLGNFTRVIPDRMSDRMQVLYGAVRENDSKINLRIQPFISRGLHSCALLDLWSIFRVNSFEELWPSHSHFLIFIVINAKNFSRPEEHAGTHIPGPAAGVGQFLRLSQVTLTPPQRLFRSLALGGVHNRSNKLDFTRLISFSMSHNMDIFDGTIRHQQALLKIKILPVPRRANDCLFHQGRVFRMNPLENKFHGGFRRSIVLEDSKGFFRPDDVAGGGPPAETPGVA